MSGIACAKMYWRKQSETIRKFKKKGGQREVPVASATFQQTYGFAALEALVVDISRKAETSDLNLKIRQETRAYQSWLEAYTDFEKVDSRGRPVPERVVRRKGKRNLKLHRSPVCELLPWESWGDCEQTIEKSIRAAIQSEKSREVGKGHLKLVKDYPLSWNQTEMSKQVPIKGYENRRPPTFVQLLADAHRPTDQSKPKVSVDVEAANDDPIERAIACNYASPSIDEQDEQLAAVFDGQETVTPTIESQPRHYRHVTTNADYVMWLENPEYMRRMLYLAHDNYYAPTQEDLYSFYWRTQLDDEARYNLWLCEHDQFNPCRYPFLISDEKNLYRRRLEDVRARRRQGLITKEGFDSVEKLLLKTLAFTQKPPRLAKNASLVFACEGQPDYTRDEKIALIRANNGSSVVQLDYRGVVRDAVKDAPFFAQQIGLDCMPPMGVEEYEDITRVDANDIDVHLCAESIVARVGPSEVLQYSSFKHYTEAKAVRPSLLVVGDAFLAESDSGLYVPNSESTELLKVIKQVSQ